MLVEAERLQTRRRPRADRTVWAEFTKEYNQRRKDPYSEETLADYARSKIVEVVPGGGGQDPEQQPEDDI